MGIDGGGATLWLIAGANGVGKTTFARARIAAISKATEFVNIGLIAQGLSPLDPSSPPGARGAGGA
jgi:predicted ABC-type ATPase